MSNGMYAYGPQAYGTYWFPSAARTVPAKKNEKNEWSKARRKRDNKENDENNG